jgi:O-antigen/teichoic acid export membrane protein
MTLGIGHSGSSLRPFVARLFAATRGAIAARMAMLGALNKVVGLVATLITVPLIIGTFGEARFGLWMAFTTLILIVQLADGGVSSGLLTLVAQASGTDDKARIRALSSTAFAASVFVGVVLLAVALVSMSVDWQWLLGISDRELAREASWVSCSIIAALALNFAAGAYKKTRVGLQQGPEANLWDLAASLLVLAAQIGAILLDLGLVGLALATLLTPVIVNIVHTVVFLAGRGRAFTPSARLIDRNQLGLLLRTGSFFALLVFFQIIAVQLDYYLVARFSGLEDLAQYAVLQKIFIQPQFAVTLAMTALFPAIGEALTRGDLQWIRLNVRRVLVFGALIGGAICALLYLAAAPIIEIWISSELRPPEPLRFWMAIFGALAVIANIIVYFFYAIGSYRKILAYYVVMTVINVPLSILLIDRMGPVGAVIGTSFAYMIAMIAPGVVSMLRTLGALEPVRDRQLQALR